jgi:3-phosphoshikimate 1-carboxyvinyltransferase
MTARSIAPLVRPPDATITVPGSKSHTNRALVCAALAGGRSSLSGVLFADDTEAMLAALPALGATVEIDRTTGTVEIDRTTGTVEIDRATGTVEIDGDLDRPGTIDPSNDRSNVDVRQSGTTGRFLLPVLAATPGRWLLDGADQLRARPFGPQLDALRALGADVEGQRLPLSIDGRRLVGGDVRVAASISSQFLSGLLLAGPLFDGRLAITVDGELVSRPYIDLTVATMAGFGVEVAESDRDGALTFTVPGSTSGPESPGGGYQPAKLAIEPDASAASYFFAAAAITGGRVRIPGLGTDTVQGDLRFVELLERMGAGVHVGDHWTEVWGTGTLRGIQADMSDISDTAQTMAVVASFADSPCELTGIGFIRHKETDRIGAVVTELNRRGIGATATDDGMIIEPGQPSPGPVATYDDHRMAMSFSLLGLVHDGIEIEDPGCVAKTFPRFFDVLDQLR